jgi:hypothetical protein
MAVNVLFIVLKHITVGIASQYPTHGDKLGLTTNTLIYIQEEENQFNDLS